MYFLPKHIQIQILSYLDHDNIERIIKMDEYQILDEYPYANQLYQEISCSKWKKEIIELRNEHCWRDFYYTIFYFFQTYDKYGIKNYLPNDRIDIINSILHQFISNIITYKLILLLEPEIYKSTKFLRFMENTIVLTSNKNLIKWIAKEFHIKIYPNVHIFRDDVEIIKFIHENQTLNITETEIRMTIIYDSIRIFKFFHELTSFDLQSYKDYTISWNSKKILSFINSQVYDHTT